MSRPHTGAYCRDQSQEERRRQRQERQQIFRWAFVKPANFAQRFCPEAKRFYERKKAKTNKIVATKAPASSWRALVTAQNHQDAGSSRCRLRRLAYCRCSLVFPYIRQRLLAFPCSTHCTARSTGPDSWCLYWFCSRKSAYARTSQTAAATYRRGRACAAPR